MECILDHVIELATAIYNEKKIINISMVELYVHVFTKLYPATT